ncbi:MAG: DinB family protein [Acidobacteriota bacterium]|nr:DinB family protein [Acidobacteriota bacterium]
MRPATTDHAAHFNRYIERVPEDDILSVIEQQSSETQKMLSSLDETRASFRYEAGKWSVKEVIGHLVDAERILGYRALAISRGETQSLPGWDEDEYVRNAHFDTWRIGDLAEAYAVARRTNIVFFRNLPDEAWDRRGVANGNPVTARALAFVLVGHERHHLAILRERYRVER